MSREVPRSESHSGPGRNTEIGRTDNRPETRSRHPRRFDTNLLDPMYQSEPQSGFYNDDANNLTSSPRHITRNAAAEGHTSYEVPNQSRRRVANDRDNSDDNDDGDDRLRNRIASLGLPPEMLTIRPTVSEYRRMGLQRSLPFEAWAIAHAEDRIRRRRSDRNPLNDSRQELRPNRHGDHEQHRCSRNAAETNPAAGHVLQALCRECSQRNSTRDRTTQIEENSPRNRSGETNRLEHEDEAPVAEQRAVIPVQRSPRESTAGSYFQDQISVEVNSSRSDETMESSYDADEMPAGSSELRFRSRSPLRRSPSRLSPDMGWADLSPNAALPSNSDSSLQMSEAREYSDRSSSPTSGILRLMRRIRSAMFSPDPIVRSSGGMNVQDAETQAEAEAEPEPEAEAEPEAEPEPEAEAEADAPDQRVRIGSTLNDVMPTDTVSDTLSQGSMEQTCPICLQSYLHATCLPCGHIFCYLCIKGAAIKLRQCPMCRREIPLQSLYFPDMVNGIADVENSESSADFQWFYSGNKGGWWKYDARTNVDLEDAFKQGKTSYRILVAGLVYIVHFGSMTQRQESDERRVRRIKRGLPTYMSKGVAGLRTENNCVVGDANMPLLTSDLRGESFGVRDEGSMTSFQSEARGIVSDDSDRLDMLDVQRANTVGFVGNGTFADRERLLYAPSGGRGRTYTHLMSQTDFSELVQTLRRMNSNVLTAARIMREAREQLIMGDSIEFVVRPIEDFRREDPWILANVNVAGLDLAQREAYLNQAIDTLMCSFDMFVSSILSLTSFLDALGEFASALRELSAIAGTPEQDVPALAPLWTYLRHFQMASETVVTVAYTEYSNVRETYGRLTPTLTRMSSVLDLGYESIDGGSGSFGSYARS